MLEIKTRLVSWISAVNDPFSKERIQSVSPRGSMDICSAGSSRTIALCGVRSLVPDACWLESAFPATTVVLESPDLLLEFLFLENCGIFFMEFLLPGC